MKYLYLFNTEEDFEKEYNDNYDEPWVSLTKISWGGGN